MSHETIAASGLKEKSGTYKLEGQLLEVCDCEVLCPCWIGEDPDGGTCDAIAAWTIERGRVNEVDVSGLTFALLAHIPGNVLQGNWKALAIVDDKASPEQQEALLTVFTGQLGGPIADFAALVGEVVAVERAPIHYTIEGGKGQITIGELANASMEPYQGATGKTTTLNESVFSTIPGSPAYVSRAHSYQRNTEQYGLKNVDLRDHNAIQGHFLFEA
jgi:hypothetical protein